MNYETIAQYSESTAVSPSFIVMVVLFRKFVLPRCAPVRFRAIRIGHTEHRREELREEVAEARGEVEIRRRDVPRHCGRAETDARHEQETIIADARREGCAWCTTPRGELDRGRIAGRDKCARVHRESAHRRAQLASHAIEP